MKVNININDAILSECKALVEPAYSDRLEYMISWILVQWMVREIGDREHVKAFLLKTGFTNEEYESISRLSPQECSHCSKDGSKKCPVHFYLYGERPKK